MLKLESYKKYLGLLIITLIAIYTRFSYPIPVAFHPDSVKYFVPLQIIYEKNFSWVLDTINFSLITRIINYFVQSLSNGATANIIIYQKMLGTISTILFFFVAKKISSNKIAVFISTLIFSLNPLMLFFEQVIMPEALFICESCAISLVLLCFIESPNIKKAILLGSLLGLHILTKDTGIFFGIAVIAALFISCLFDFKKSRKKLLSCLLLSFTTGLTLVPWMLYNKNKFNSFTLDRYKTLCPILYFLTEEMLTENPIQKHSWLTKYILSSYEDSKRSCGIPLSEKSKTAFIEGIINFCVPLRENRLTKMFIDLGLNPQDSNKILVDYYLKTIINNPKRTLESFVYNNNILLFDKNFYFSPYRKSYRSGARHESVMFTLVPYSITSAIDPLLKNATVVDSSYIDENQIYTDPSHRQVLKGYFPLMVNRDTNKIVLCPEKGFSLWLQKTFVNFPWMRILLPMFLISLILFLINIKKFFQEKNFLFYCYLIGSFLLLFGLPAIMHGEARYQLQFTHFMIWFILIVFFGNKQSTK